MTARSAPTFGALAAGAAALAISAAGCSSGSTAARPAIVDVRPARASLVGGPAAGAGWEVARNDYQLGASRAANRPDVRGTSVYTQDRLWTIDGRPFETSTTTTRSLQLRGNP